VPKIHFLPDDRTVEVKEGENIRDAALRHGIPIAHVCEGKGRCSTCRVLVLEGQEYCSRPTEKEKDIARFVSFSNNIRLACQTTITGDVKVRRLTLDEYDVDLTSKFIMGNTPYLAGVEKHVFIMFVDIRRFTAFAGSLLPYDVIHILHRFFHFMDTVISEYGGTIDNYMGDGLMALFEVDDPEEGALMAVKAGLEMLRVHDDRIRPYIHKLFGRSFDIGIGLHYGLVVAGTIGGGDNKKTTVIGDAVNFASRIEAANKQTGSRFLISQDTYDKIADFARIHRTIQLRLPGRSEVQTLYEVTGVIE
jgi:adenylate cyclase